MRRGSAASPSPRTSLTFSLLSPYLMPRDPLCATVWQQYVPSYSGARPAIARSIATPPEDRHPREFTIEVVLPVSSQAPRFSMTARGRNLLDKEAFSCRISIALEGAGPKWRNRQTRCVQGAVGFTPMWVQLPPSALARRHIRAEHLLQTGPAFGLVSCFQRVQDTGTSPMSLMVTSCRLRLAKSRTCREQRHLATSSAGFFPQPMLTWCVSDVSLFIGMEGAWASPFNLGWCHTLISAPTSGQAQTTSARLPSGPSFHQEHPGWPEYRPTLWCEGKEAGTGLALPIWVPCQCRGLPLFPSIGMLSMDKRDPRICTGRQCRSLSFAGGREIVFWQAEGADRAGRYQAKRDSQVIRELLSGDKSPAQLPEARGIHSNTAGNWKSALVERRPDHRTAHAGCDRPSDSCCAGSPDQPPDQRQSRIPTSEPLRGQETKHN